MRNDLLVFLPGAVKIEVGQEWIGLEGVKAIRLPNKNVACGSVRLLLYKEDFILIVDNYGD